MEAIFSMYLENYTEAQRCSMKKNKLPASM